MNSDSGINRAQEGGNQATTRIYRHFYICKLCLAFLSLVSGHKPGKRKGGNVGQRVERVHGSIFWLRRADLVGSSRVGRWSRGLVRGSSSLAYESIYRAYASRNGSKLGRDARTKLLMKEK
jgi:hypothetical protein